jgi:hypothetical protein
MSMKDYPSSQSVPSAVNERVFFTIGIVLPLLAALVYGIGLGQRDGTAGTIMITVLGAAGITLFAAAPFFIVGFLFRYKRLKRLARRQSFLASLRDLNSPS